MLKYQNSVYSLLLQGTLSKRRELELWIDSIRVTSCEVVLGYGGDLEKMNQTVQKVLNGVKFCILKCKMRIFDVV